MYVSIFPSFSNGPINYGEGSENSIKRWNVRYYAEMAIEGHDVSGIKRIGAKT